jgi:hypothetical protein
VTRSRSPVVPEKALHGFWDDSRDYLSPPPVRREPRTGNPVGVPKIREPRLFSYPGELSWIDPLKEIFKSIHTDARVTLAKAVATVLAIAAQGVLIGALFERFG